MSTFLNEGLAIPHAVVPGLREVNWAMGVPKMGLSYVGDAVRADLVVLALYSHQSSEQYLSGIARLASDLRNSRRVELMRSVSTSGRVRGLDSGGQVNSRFKIELR